MGSSACANLALQAIEKGIRVVGFTKGGVQPELRNAGVVAIDSLPGFRDALHPPRKILSTSLRARPSMS